MRAAVYRGINDVRVETVPVPKIGPGEVLIRVHSCGVCGTDLKKIHTGSHSAPRIFGHEIAGVIAATGEGVRGFEAGDRVMVFHHTPCGKCYYCRHKTPSQCNDYKRVGVTAGFEPSGGGFAEYVRVLPWIVGRGLIKLPDHVSFEQAAFVEPVNTVYKAIRNLALEPDETVLVIGQGPIGIMHPERHRLAAHYGLDHPIDASREDVVAVAHRESEGRGADAVIVAVGGNALIKTAMDAARPGGRVLLFAATQHCEATFDPAVVCMDEKTLMGSYSSSFDLQPEVEEIVFGGYRTDFDLTRLISHRFALEDAVEAIRVASNPSAASMKVFVQPEAAQV
jgi:L-iditol 2-dehydrogenase